MDFKIELILPTEKLLLSTVTAFRCIVKCVNITSRTKCLLASTANDNRFNIVLLRPIVQSQRYFVNHVMRKRIECLGAVEGDGRDVVSDVSKDVV